MDQIERYREIVRQIVTKYASWTSSRDDIRSETYARHVDHVVQLVGPKHVSIALDYVFDMRELEAYLAKMKHTFPPELGYSTEPSFVAPEQLPEIVATLLGWGYRETDLADILGGNLMRLARQLWKPAQGFAHG